MASPLLEVTDLACRRGGRPVFDRLSFGLAAGDLLALTGRNGSGKTTLLRALALLVRAEAGAIRWQGHDVTADPDHWHGQIAWLGHLDGLKGDLTVAENLATANRLRGAAGDIEGSDIAAALAAFDLAALARRPVRTLSAGQRRRSALARVAASGAPLWLLDEPLNALDAAAQLALRGVLAAHLGNGGAAIAATHAPLDGARTLAMGGS
jgi:heme exporter protein A